MFLILDKDGRKVLEYSSKEKAMQVLDCLNAFAVGSGNSYTLKEI